MSDALLALSRNPMARGLIRGLGLPTPVSLQRASGSVGLRPLDGLRVMSNANAGSDIGRRLGSILTDAGAALIPASESSAVAVDALLFDASGMREIAQSHDLYAFFHSRLATLSANGRVVLIARDPGACDTPEAAALARGCEGFVRSLAKEVGRRGATANLIYLGLHAEDRLDGPLRYLLSARSAFVSGQPISVSAAVSSQATHASLHGKLALVTGAAQGLGAAIAQRLAEEGAQVLCVDIPASAQALEATSGRVGGTALGMDVTGEDACARIVDRLQQLQGGVDIVVHNAGVIRDRTLAKMDATRWSQCMAVNLDAILRIDAALLDADLLRDDGRVICLSSIAGVAGNVGQTNYAMTKAALIGYVAAQARRLAARGITVNAVAPGLIETPMMMTMPFLFREVARRMNSLSQAGIPADIADAVGFLVAPDALGVSGQTLRVCGQNLLGA
ncbi:MAG: 3-oxoacyl-ACP reductase [Pseudomonadota bacterium]|nr:3-oxoacyl-ACP reductase [Pseudomonadota bacterium]